MWSKIERYSNWGYWDRLDGTNLVNGEQLIVRWPDGLEQHIAARVIVKPYPYSDHGHTYTGEDLRAYAVVDHHGVEGLIPLAGLEAKRA